MSFEIFLIIGMVGMLLCMLYCGKKYQLSKGKVVVSSVVLTIAGVIGIYLMGFLENGSWGARSFYGAVFAVPLLMWIDALILRLPYGVLLDVCAPAGCIMLSLMKIKCQMDGCCGGRFFPLKNGELVRFPSQIVECIVSLILGIFLVMTINTGKRKGMVYPVYLIGYGLTRFILTFFRYPKPWIGPIPAGAFWSLIAIAAGLFVLVFDGKKKHQHER